MKILARAGYWAAVAGVRHPVRTMAVLLLLAVLAALLLLRQEHFDSEILDLLPADVPAVRGLKIYQHDFAQARELAFFFESPEDVDLTGEFRSYFAGRLAREPWVVRWVDAPPTEMPGALETLVPFALPLLLKQEPSELEERLRSLSPELLRDRLQQLTRRMQAGSPLAAFELTWDPLGFLAPLSARLESTISLDEGFSLTAPDGSAQIFSVITNQPTLEAADCVEMMRRVRRFVAEAREDFGEGAPEVLITGRSAYVEEIAASMRRDIMLTSVVSGLGISVLFLLAFGSLRSLAGLLGLLVLSALLALAAGLIFFPTLNLIAMAFCSILFGLGVDFGFLLLERFRRAGTSDPFQAVAETVADRLPGIAGVAVTTAIGFLALTFSDSAGFSQLGVLTAVGILGCAILLPTALLMAVPGRQAGCAAATPPPLPLSFLLANKKGLRLFLVFFWLGAAAACFWPGRSLSFDVSPRSLEPRDTPASQALQRMMQAFPATFEPLLLVVPTGTGLPPAETALALERRLAEWRSEGLVTGFSGASLLLPQPEATALSTKVLGGTNWEEVRRAWREAAEAAGLRRESDHPADTLLDGLEAAGRGELPSWERDLPADSPWWFLLDRTLAPNSSAFLLYVRPGSAEAADRILRAMAEEFPGVLATGWSVMLRELQPWAWRELQIFGFGVTGVILVVLAVLYRSWRLWSIHLFLLATSGMVILGALKLLDVRVNLLNVLAFPLILGVGVDYATHFLLACRQPGREAAGLGMVFKPVTLSGLTTMIGFGALTLAKNPALSGLGLVCLIGIGSCLLVTCLFAPCLAAWSGAKYKNRATLSTPAPP